MVFLIKSMLSFFWFISIGHLYSSITSHTTTTLYIKHHVPRLTPGLTSRQDRQFLGRSTLFVMCFSLDEISSQKPEHDCVWMDLDKSFALVLQPRITHSWTIREDPPGQPEKGATRMCCVKGLIPNPFACCNLGMGEIY